jgi:hypothetical protein
VHGSCTPVITRGHQMGGDAAPANSGCDTDTEVPPPYGGLIVTQRTERVLAYDEPSYGFVSMAVVGVSHMFLCLSPGRRHSARYLTRFPLSFASRQPIHFPVCRVYVVRITSCRVASELCRESRTRGTTTANRPSRPVVSKRNQKIFRRVCSSQTVGWCLASRTLTRGGVAARARATGGWRRRWRRRRRKRRSGVFITYKTIVYKQRRGGEQKRCGRRAPRAAAPSSPPR